MTNAELEQLAIDAVAGRIFTSFDCPNDRLLPLVFMPLALMNGDDIKSLRGGEPVMLYEYVSEAGPRSINGMPMFFSFRYLNREDFDKFRDRFNEVYELLQSRLKAAKDE